MKNKFILTVIYILIFFNSNLLSDENNNILKVGLLAPLSGVYSELGNSILYSLQLALEEIDDKNIFIVPLIVIILIIKKTPPIIALFTGTILGAIFAIIFQQDILTQLSNSSSLTFDGAYSAIINSITIDTNIESGNSELNDLFKSGGMFGMMNTIWLVISAMVFGGVMESIGALKTITTSLLNLGKSTFSLFASTAGSCLAINLTTSDQYLAIVIPGKMYEKAFKEKNLAPENLSRTLEDTGTVTSVLIPWNSCGAYQSGVLGVSVIDYFFYAIFNWLSFFMTLLVAGLNYKIKKLEIKKA